MSPSRKCEWPEIKPFVDRLNKELGSNFKLERLLDVVIRNRPAPEVILSDSKNRDRLVIERKALVSPTDREKFIGCENRFSNLIWEKLGSIFNNESYILRIIQPRGTKREIKAQVNEITNNITKNKKRILSGQRIEASKPFPWSFGKMNEFEKDPYGGQKGIAVYVDIPTPDYFDPRVVSITIKNIKTELERLLLATSKKFIEYEDNLKILLLERHIDITLSADYIKDILHGLSCPSNIDQIWFGEPGWSPNDECIFEYNRLL